RRDVVDRLAQATLLRVDEPLERAPLDVDQVGDLEHGLEARETAARTGSVSTCQNGDSLELVGRRGSGGAQSATRQNSRLRSTPYRGVRPARQTPGRSGGGHHGP